MSELNSGMSHSMSAQTESEQSAAATATLQCDICGVTGGRRGGAFRSARDLMVHKAHAHRGVGRKHKIEPEAGGMATNRVAVHHSPQAQAHSHAKFCPQCGCNLAVVNAALAFVDGRNLS